ncbi:hypothetical protein CC78DRAFT_166680 [Lojkania enalia]|uniref:Uncharacterized protein n=1 Tax=Lojkania enalia TaxID=147567 RepID=A0A9P4JWP4_9PLEO|nr:hypothetical protein CC78DRAFT_166680 [Didymosphaeria enalia]
MSPLGTDKTDIMDEKPDSKIPAHLQEVASLMDDIYKTFAKMTFIPEMSIKRGPHTISSELTQQYELDPIVIKLMEILPYVDREEIDERVFLYGGEFIDFRNVEDLEQSRDPLYSSWETEGQLSFVIF